MQPLYQNLPYLDAETVFANFADEPGAVWLDSSSQQHREWSRYSYIGIRPFAIFSATKNAVSFAEQLFDGNPFDFLQHTLQNYSLTPHNNLPPFQGGVIGYFGYELNQHVENVPLAKIDDQQFPDMMLGFYDVIIAFDHTEKQCWLISSGLPEIDRALREKRAQQRLNEIAHFLKTSTPNNFITWQPIERTAVKSNFSSQQAYENSVASVIEYIYAGDIFQANLTQRFMAQAPENANFFALYQRLRAINPAPFAGYLNFGDIKLASASPERFLQLHNHQIETCPIKGTRKRGNNPDEDILLQNALLSSDKDRAENTMIVDLLRNDLSRVAKLHSVNVKELCALYSFATVHHLVSTVTAELKIDLDAIDVLRVTFPGGSITGAPKIRAMEIIAELEPTTRGPYCGCFGYIGFDGSMDTAITIRTYCIKENTISFQVGGGIVADSIPADEYAETLTKAKALFEALS